MSLPYAGHRLDATWTATCKGLRIGLQLDAGWGLPVEPEVRAAVEAAAQAFERAGAIVEPIAAFSTRAMIDGMDRFWRMRTLARHLALPPERRDKVLPYIRQWVARAARASAAAEVFRRLQPDGRAARRRGGRLPAVRLRAVAGEPGAEFAAEWASPTNDPERPFEHIAFTLPFNMSEQPAASINCGYTPTGLPIGLQIIGHRHDDLGVLQVSRAYEQLRPAQRPWPFC